MSDAPRLGRSTLPVGYRTARPAGLPGIVHLGLGNFHRAHQGVYTARALELEPGPWGINAFSNRSESVVQAMRAQDLLYAVLQISPQGCSVSVPGVHVRVDVAAADPAAVVAAIAAPSTKIVTLTVTEHGYTYSPTTHDLDLSALAVQRDLAHPEHPQTSVGRVAAGLVQRFASGGEPVSVVSCDNLGGNGALLRRLVTSFVTHGSLPPSPEFLAWLADHVSFPSTMVDRIVPATSPAHRALAAELLGVRDAVPVPAEPFSMWVLQDDFVAGRPAWERAGAIFSDDVEAYEVLKLRLLNGTHSLIAYLGVLAGAETIAAAVAVPDVEAAARALVRDEYLPTVRVPEGVDVDRYVAELFHRFSNSELAHRTSQVGSDGSQKLPQRVTAPALQHLQRGDVPQLICLTVAAFLACVAPRDGHRGDLADEIRDPMLPALRSLAAEAHSARGLVDSVFDGTNFLPPALTSVALFRRAVAELLDTLERHGPQAAVREALG